jgi:invasion protein IalB
MKLLPAFALAALLPAAAFAADSSAPTSLGTFGDWTAATYGTGAKKACYAFTKAQASSEAIANRGDVLLVVTERKSGHDEVTLSAGYTYPAKPTVTLDIGGPKIDFYTQGATAFTTSGAAAITAFQQGSLAIAKSSDPSGGSVTDNFSLAGFSDAYSAITTACP